MKGMPCTRHDFLELGPNMGNLDLNRSQVMIGTPLVSSDSGVGLEDKINVGRVFGDDRFDCVRVTGQSFDYSYWT